MSMGVREYGWVNLEIERVLPFGVLGIPSLAERRGERSADEGDVSPADSLLPACLVATSRCHGSSLHVRGLRLLLLAVLSC
jgi:hypothetical protein